METRAGFGRWAFGGTVMLAALTGCRDVRDNFRPVLTDAPFVYDMGELRVIGNDELEASLGNPQSISDALVYGQLGAGENAGQYGGATFNFTGTGGDVCVVVDPEALFWNKEISQDATNRYKYEDVFEDDGDVDLSVGLTAYYTGSPGEEVGTFDATYTDDLGTEHTLAFDECVQTGLFGDPAHAGRATVEYCTIDTSLRPGVSYTALLKTFALPIDDSILNFGAMVYDGPCATQSNDVEQPDGTTQTVVTGLTWLDTDGVVNHGASECVIPNEVGNAEADGEAPDEKAWFPDAETAYCSGKGKFNSFCSDHVDDDYPPCNEADY
jgi:hypothetical protein